MVVRQSEIPPVRPYKVSWFPNSINNKLVHHRLDLLPPPNLCRHLNQVATIGKCTEEEGIIYFKVLF